MKKILIILIIAAGLSVISCKKLEDLNVDNKRATEVSSSTLFSNAQRNLVDQETTPSVNRNVFRTFSQYWTETTYTDESNYNITTRLIPDFEFRTLYRDVLNNFKEAKRVIPTESELVSSAAEKKNRIAITEILSVYTFQRLVDIFGNIPYDNSLDITKITPSYDNAQGIYSKLFARLDAAIADLNTGAGSFGGADLIYNGNVEKWRVFANSLKLKMAITVADVPELNPDAKAASALADGVMASTADNASFAYLSSPPSTNPVWVELVASGRYDWVAANTLVDQMNALNDPRRDDYFDDNLTDSLGTVYKGGIYAQNSTYGSYTHITPTVQLADRPGLLLDYTEVQFYLAEAVERGFIGGSAATYYNEAVTSSILFWGGNNADALTYLANPNVAYATAPGTYKEKIGTQAWLAYYDRGLIGWTTWRRLDAPMFNPPSGKTIADIPTRFTYPISEQTLNGPNYSSAASAIGGDLLTTKLFWDKYN